jgi:hypothetical protein
MSTYHYKKTYLIAGLERPLGLQDVEVHEGGKVVSPTDRPPLTPRRYSWNSFNMQSYISYRLHLVILLFIHKTAQCNI